MKFFPKNTQNSKLVVDLYSPRGQSDSHSISFGSQNPLVLKAQSNQEYRFSINKTGIAPEKLSIKREKDNIVIYIEDDLELFTTVIIENYFLYPNQYLFGMDAMGFFHPYQNVNNANSEISSYSIIGYESFNPSWVKHESDTFDFFSWKSYKLYTVGLVGVGGALVLNSFNKPTNSKGDISIDGEAKQGNTLFAKIKDGDKLDNKKVHYQWKRNGKKIEDATEKSYKLIQEDVNNKITVSAYYTDDSGNYEYLNSKETDKVKNINDKPEIEIEGELKQNEILTAKISDKDGLPKDKSSIKYQWFSNNKKLEKQTSETLKITKDLVGKSIYVTAEYTDKFDQDESVKSGTQNIPKVNFDGNVYIIGDLKESSTLVANVSDENGLPNKTIRYQWLRDGKNITGANGNSYTLVQEDVGKKISVTASYSDSAGNFERVTSKETEAIENKNNSPQVKIKGNLIQGETIKADIEDIDGLPANIEYTWFANNQKVSTNTTGILKLTQNEVGKRISVQVKYTDKFGATETKKSSTSTSAVQDKNDLGTVSIEGEANVDETLTAVVQDLDGIKNNTTRYQWLADNVEISGANNKTYKLTANDLNKSIQVKVSYTDTLGKAENIVSINTEKVSAASNNAQPRPLSISDVLSDDSSLLFENTQSSYKEVNKADLSYNYLVNEDSHITDLLIHTIL